MTLGSFRSKKVAAGIAAVIILNFVFIYSATPFSSLASDLPLILGSYGFNSLLAYYTCSVLLLMSRSLSSDHVLNAPIGRHGSVGTIITITIIDSLLSYACASHICFSVPHSQSCFDAWSSLSFALSTLSLILCGLHPTTSLLFYP